VHNLKPITNDFIIDNSLQAWSFSNLPSLAKKNFAIEPFFFLVTSLVACFNIKSKGTNSFISRGKRISAF